jgi:hypothetical protein
MDGPGLEMEHLGKMDGPGLEMEHLGKRGSYLSQLQGPILVLGKFISLDLEICWAFLPELAHRDQSLAESQVLYTAGPTIMQLYLV